MSKKRIDVAIALLFHRDAVLVGWRESQQHQGNKNEFPGGKVEEGETPIQACRREVVEEVGLDIEQWFPFDLICHEYDDIIVQLHIFSGYVDSQQKDQIQQPWAWYRREQLAQLNFPKANDRIIHRLLWPEQCHIIQCVNALDLNVMMNPLQSLSCLISDTGLVNPQDIFHAYPVEQKKQLLIPIEIYRELAPNQREDYAGAYLNMEKLARNRHDAAIDQAPWVGVKTLAYCSVPDHIEQALMLGVDALFYAPRNQASEKFSTQNIKIRGRLVSSEDVNLSQSLNDVGFTSNCHIPIYWMQDDS